MPPKPSKKAAGKTAKDRIEEIFGAKREDEHKDKQGVASSLEFRAAAKTFGWTAHAGVFDAGRLLNGIPSTCVLSILTFADTPAIINLQVTCKSNYRVLRHEAVWKAHVYNLTVVTPQSQALIHSKALTWEQLAVELGRVLRLVSKNLLFGYAVPRVLRDVWFEIILHENGSFGQSTEKSAAAVFESQPDLSFWIKNQFLIDMQFVDCVLADDDDDTESFLKTLRGKVAWIGYEDVSEVSHVFGYWLGGDGKKGGVHEYTPDTAPVLSWDCYLGAEEQLATWVNLTSFLVWKELHTDYMHHVEEWSRAHGSVESVPRNDPLTLNGRWEVGGGMVIKFGKDGKESE